MPYTLFKDSTEIAKEYGLVAGELDRLGIELFNNIKEENQYKNKIMEIITTYYDRIMCDELVQHITQELDWLIPFVKRHESLDFQTGHDPKQNRS